MHSLRGSRGTRRRVRGLGATVPRATPTQHHSAEQGWDHTHSEALETAAITPRMVHVLVDCNKRDSEHSGHTNKQRWPTTMIDFVTSVKDTPSEGGLGVLLSVPVCMREGTRDNQDRGTCADG